MSKCTLTRAAEIPVNVWSGGRTRELFIYPPDSNYAARNFAVRVSSATIEQSSSTFTHLPKYTRVLMPLDAPLTLEFDGERKTELEPFIGLEFKGSRAVVSHGLCTDIGIMFARGWDGFLEIAEEGENPCAVLDCSVNFFGLYALRNDLELTFSGEAHTLMHGDFLFAEMHEPCNKKAKLVITSEGEHQAALVYIWKK